MNAVTTMNLISSSGYIKIRISPNDFLKGGVDHFHIRSLIQQALPEEIINQHSLDTSPGRIKTMDIESVSLVASNHGDYDPEIELNIGWMVESPSQDT